MNKTASLTPAPDQAAAPQTVIGIHVGNTDSEVTFKLLPGHFPPQNFIGTLLLRRLLLNALQYAGLGSSVGITGPMEDCVILCGVSNGGAAVELIKTELAAVSMLSFSQIGICEDGRWHCVYPSPAVRMDYLLDTERHELHDARREQSLRSVIQQAAEISRHHLTDPNLSEKDRASLAESLRLLEEQLDSLHPEPEAT